MYEDKTLVCKECGNEFVFTAGEQEFYAEKGFTNENRSVARLADRLVKMLPRQRENSLKPFALNAAELQRFLSSLLKAKATIAANVLQKEKQLNN